jgi:adenylate cyclase
LPIRAPGGGIERLAAVPTDPGFVLHELQLLRLRALLARAHGDETSYCDFRDRYRDMAKSLGFEGHMKCRGDALTPGIQGGPPTCLETDDI